MAKLTAKFLIALFALSCVARPHPRRQHAHKNRPRAEPASNPTTAYQLDRDIIGDRVTLQSNGVEKMLSIRFGNLRHQQIGFKTQTDDSGHLVAGDIDRDGDVDLIWVGAADRKSAVVLINDGEGNFAEASDVSAYASELDGLFNSNDPSGNQKLKRGRKSSSLASASF